MACGTWNSPRSAPGPPHCLIRLPTRDCSVQNLPLAFAGSKGVRRICIRLGNWLTADQGRNLLLKPLEKTLEANGTMRCWPCFVGWGLRRGELLALTMRSIQLREEHWVVADVHGKAGHIGTVPIPFGSKKRSTVGPSPAQSSMVGCFGQSTRPVRSGATE